MYAAMNKCLFGNKIMNTVLTFTNISCCNTFMATLAQVIHLHKYFFVFDLETLHPITIV